MLTDKTKKKKGYGSEKAGCPPIYGLIRVKESKTMPANFKSHKRNRQYIKTSYGKQTWLLIL